MSYSQIQSLGSCGYFEYGDNQMFFTENISGDWRVRRLLMASDTVETISDNSSFEAGDTVQEVSGFERIRPIYLNGNLVMCTSFESGSTYLYKAYTWNGGMSWTKQLEYDASPWFPSMKGVLSKSSNQIILTVRNGANAGNFGQHVVKYSSDGIAWSNGSIVWNTSPTFTPTGHVIHGIHFSEPGVIDPLLFDIANRQPTSFDFYIVICQWNGFNWSSYDWHQFIWPSTNTGSTWVQTAFSNIANSLRDLMFWYSATDDYQDGLPNGGIVSLDNTHSRGGTLNFNGSGKKGFGKIFTGGELKVAALGSDYLWEADEVVDTLNYTFRYAIRSTATLPYVVFSDGSNNHLIYKGTTVYPNQDIISGAAKLYYGVNNIANNVPIQVT